MGQLPREPLCCGVGRAQEQRRTPEGAQSMGQVPRDRSSPGKDLTGTRPSQPSSVRCRAAMAPTRAHRGHREPGDRVQDHWQAPRAEAEAASLAGLPMPRGAASERGRRRRGPADILAPMCHPTCHAKISPPRDPSLPATQGGSSDPGSRSQGSLPPCSSVHSGAL